MAGEPSGDLLASGLMEALRKAVPAVQFRGVGGESMAAHGLESLFDIAEISVMGFFEVVPRLPLILKRIRMTADDIVAWQPDVVVTVDSWGFVSALLTRLRKKGVKIPIVHYVAPQVWAWKKGRAKNVAQLVDRLMTLLPDEGKYFEPYGLRCDFVGHPVTERMQPFPFDKEMFRKELDIPSGAPVVTVLPGSRRSEIDRLVPIFKEALSRIRVQYGDFYVVVPTVPAVEKRVRKLFSGSEVPVRVITGTANRYKAFSVSEFAIAKSGTVSLELAALGVPHLIAYKFSTLTNFAVRMVIKIRFANIINLLAGREIIPEFVLHNCRADMIADSTIRLLNDKQAAAAQVREAQEVMRRLRLPDIMPSERAAQIVLECSRTGCAAGPQPDRRFFS